MSDAAFGRLVSVDIRQAWIHEAQDFTPWLAANLDRLAETLGIGLELEKAEARVGRYSADIVARNPQDGSTVLIENQLEFSDHTHLGQILTYLTGLEAQTIVWVAPEFREEHRSAIKWLNEHTVDPFAFFAVRVRVVRIGDSAMAPLFEILEQPNEWDRRVQSIAKEAREASPIVEFRRAFWDHVVARHPQIGFVPTSVSNNWAPVPGTDLQLSAWTSLQSVGLFVRGGRGQGGVYATERLAPFIGALESGLGVEVGNPQHPYAKEYPIDLTDRANWDAAADWLADEIRRYSISLSQVLGDGQ